MDKRLSVFAFIYLCSIAGAYSQNHHSTNVANIPSIVSQNTSSTSSEGVTSSSNTSSSINELTTASATLTDTTAIIRPPGNTTTLKKPIIIRTGSRSGIEPRSVNNPSKSKKKRGYPSHYVARLFELCPPLAPSCPACTADSYQLPPDFCSSNFVVLKLVLISPPLVDSYGRVCGKFGKLALYGNADEREFRSLLRFSVAESCGCALKTSKQFYVITRLSELIKDGQLFHKISLSAESFLVSVDHYSEADILQALRDCSAPANPPAEMTTPYSQIYTPPVIHHPRYFSTEAPQQPYINVDYSQNPALPPPPPVQQPPIYVDPNTSNQLENSAKQSNPEYPVNPPIQNVGEQYPSNPLPNVGEQYPANQPPNVAKQNPFNPLPNVGDQYPANQPPNVGEQYPSNPLPNVGDQYPANQPPNTYESYPVNPSQNIGEQYPANPSSNIGEQNAATTSYPVLSSYQPPPVPEEYRKIQTDDSAGTYYPQSSITYRSKNMGINASSYPSFNLYDSNQVHPKIYPDPASKIYYPGMFQGGAAAVPQGPADCQDLEMKTCPLCYWISDVGDLTQNYCAASYAYVAVLNLPYQGSYPGSAGYGSCLNLRSSLVHDVTKGKDPQILNQQMTLQLPDGCSCFSGTQGQVIALLLSFDPSPPSPPVSQLSSGVRLFGLIAPSEIDLPDCGQYAGAGSYALRLPPSQPRYNPECPFPNREACPLCSDAPPNDLCSAQFAVIGVLELPGLYVISYKLPSISVRTTQSSYQAKSVSIKISDPPPSTCVQGSVRVTRSLISAYYGQESVIPFVALPNCPCLRQKILFRQKLLILSTMQPTYSESGALLLNEDLIILPGNSPLPQCGPPPPSNYPSQPVETETMRQSTKRYPERQPYIPEPPGSAYSPAPANTQETQAQYIPQVLPQPAYPPYQYQNPSTAYTYSSSGGGYNNYTSNLLYVPPILTADSKGKEYYSQPPLGYNPPPETHASYGTPPPPQYDTSPLYYDTTPETQFKYDDRVTPQIAYDYVPKSEYTPDVQYETNPSDAAVPATDYPASENYATEAPKPPDTPYVPGPAEYVENYATEAPKPPDAPYVPGSAEYVENYATDALKPPDAPYVPGPAEYVGNYGTEAPKPPDAPYVPGPAEYGGNYATEAPKAPDAPYVPGPAEYGGNYATEAPKAPEAPSVPGPAEYGGNYATEALQAPYVPVPSEYNGNFATEAPKAPNVPVPSGYPSPIPYSTPNKEYNNQETNVVSYSSDSAGSYPYVGNCDLSRNTGCPTCLDYLPYDFQERYCSSKYIVIVAIGLNHTAIQNYNDDPRLLIFNAEKPQYVELEDEKKGEYTGTESKKLIVTVTKAKTVERRNGDNNYDYFCFYDKLRGLYDIYPEANNQENIRDLIFVLPSGCDCVTFDIGPAYGIFLSYTEPAYQNGEVRMTGSHAFYGIPKGSLVLPTCSKQAYQPQPGYLSTTQPLAVFTAPSTQTLLQDNCGYSFGNCFTLRNGYYDIPCTFQFAAVVKILETSAGTYPAPSLQIFGTESYGTPTLRINVASMVYTAAGSEKYNQGYQGCKYAKVKVLKELSPYPQYNEQILTVLAGERFNCDMFNVGTGVFVLLSKVALTSNKVILDENTEAINILPGTTSLSYCSQPIYEPYIPAIPNPTYPPPPSIQQENLPPYQPPYSPEQSYPSETAVRPSAYSTTPGYSSSAMIPYAPYPASVYTEAPIVYGTTSASYERTTFIPANGDIAPASCVAKSCPVCKEIKSITADVYCNAKLALLVRSAGLHYDEKKCSNGILFSIYDLTPFKQADLAALKIIYSIPTNCSCPILKNNSFAVFIKKTPISLSNPLTLELSSDVHLYWSQAGQVSLPVCSSSYNSKVQARSKGLEASIVLKSPRTRLRKIQEEFKPLCSVMDHTCPTCKTPKNKQELEKLVCSASEVLMISRKASLKKSTKFHMGKLAVTQKITGNTFEMDINAGKYPCNSPLDEESCNKTETRWFYDVEEEKCSEYPSCKGNNNNDFSSNQECEDICLVEDFCEEGIFSIEKIIKSNYNKTIYSSRLFSYALPEHCECQEIMTDYRGYLVFEEEILEWPAQLNRDYTVIALSKDLKESDISCEESDDDSSKHKERKKSIM